MKIVLQKDVKNLGKVGDAVSVSAGYARNFLFPRKLAVSATEKSLKQVEHIKKVAEIKQKKAQTDRKGLTDKINGVTLSFKMAAGESDKLFGSVTSFDISEALEKQGFAVDKRDIHLENHIKDLGQHKATVKLGDGLEAEIAISVEKLD